MVATISKKAKQAFRQGSTTPGWGWGRPGLSRSSSWGWGDLKVLSYTIRNSLSHIFLYKAKSHAGIAGNECADALAKYQACHGSSHPAETSTRTAGPGGNPFFYIGWPWLAVQQIEETNQQGPDTEAPQHTALD